MAAIASPSNPSSYTRKRIDLTFTLGPKTNLLTGVTTQPTFTGSNNSNQVKLSRLRVSAAIQQAGGSSQGALDLRVYGMTQSLMNDLFSITGSNSPIVANSNTVIVEAGDDVSGVSIVYNGSISNARADYSGAPDTAFQVTGLSAYKIGLTAATPTSFPGTADVATIMGSIASRMGFAFENNGVSVKLSNPYFPGDLLTQAETVKRHAGIEMICTDGVLAIWPKGGSRGGVVPLISPETGMIGYPVKTALGVECTTLFNPSIRFGGKVQVQSSNTPCCGTWSVYQMTHNLEAEMPDGQWFTHLTLIPVGFISLNTQTVLSS